MDLKKRISSFLNQVLSKYRLSQRDLACLLGIGPGRLSAYVKGRELPRADILIKLAEIGGVTVDDLLKTEKDPEDKEILVVVKGDGNVTPVAGRDLQMGDIYVNKPPDRITYKYSYQKGDLTDEQAGKIQRLVNDIVETEKIVKVKPVSHAAVYNALRRRFKVGYYRKIGEENFELAEKYLNRWRGRVQRAKSFPKKAPDLFHKRMYRAIFSGAQNQLGWSKEGVNDYIYSLYGVQSIRHLTDQQLEDLYNKINGLKKAQNQS